MFKLIHISDVHLSPMPAPTFLQLCSKRITGYLNWRLNRSNLMGHNPLSELVEDIKHQNADHIAVSGDLTNLALEVEFLRAKDWLKGLGDEEFVSIILGNHDAYVPGAIKTAIQHLWPHMRGDEVKEAALINHEDVFPYLRVRGEVALIGVNSAQATLPFYATGYFLKQQAEKLVKLLQFCKSENLFRVVMIHHPPVTGAAAHHKRLIGIERFQEVVRQAGAELILHGHTHLATLNHIEGNEAGQQVPVLCVPSASQGVGGHKPAARYNLIEIDRVDDHWCCNWRARGFDEHSTGIHEIHQQKLL